MKSVSQAISRLTYNDSIPSGLTILSGASGVGKTIFAQQFAYETLLNNGRVLWITTEELPSTLKTSMANFGWNCDRFEKEGKLQIFDAVSPARLGISENIGRGVVGLDPTGMLIVISEQLRQETPTDDSNFLIIIDSISRLLLSCEAKPVIDFVACLSSRLENYKVRGLATVSEGAHDEKILNALTFSSTGTIRFKITEHDNVRSRQFRIETLRGKKHEDKWQDYSITATGLDVNV